MIYFQLNLVVTLSIYLYITTIVTRIISQQGNDFYSSLAVLTLFSLSFLINFWVNKWPLTYYGLSLTNAKQACIEALGYTIPFLLLIYAIHCSISYAQHLPIQDFWNTAFNTHFVFKGVGTLPGYCLYILYFVLAYLQELIVRGGVQGSLHLFLKGPQANLQAILIANVIFSLSHLYLSPMFAFLVFWPGLFWGWLYSKHRNIWGVGLSHGLIGIWCLYILQASWLKQLLFH